MPSVASVSRRTWRVAGHPHSGLSVALWFSVQLPARRRRRTMVRRLRLGCIVCAGARPWPLTEALMKRFSTPVPAVGHTDFSRIRARRGAE